MGAIDELVLGPGASSVTPASAPKKKVSAIDALELTPAKQPAPVQPPTAIQKSIPTPSSPTSQSIPKQPSLLSKVGQGALKFIDSLTARPVEDGTYKSPAAFLPSTIAENLVPGLKGIRDDTETAATITAGDLAREVPGQLLETAKSFVKLPIKGATELPNLLTAGMYQPKVQFNIPFLGEVTNSDYNIAKRIEEGEDPLAAILGEKSMGVLDALFFASLAIAPFQARPQTVARTPGPIEGITVKKGPQSFQPYEAPTMTKPIDPQIVLKLKSEGVPIRDTFDPKLPTYFKLKGTSGGKAVGEIVQLRPSYFDTFINKLKGDISKVPEAELLRIGEATRDVTAIQEAAKAPPPAPVPKAPIVPAVPPVAPSLPPVAPAVVPPVAPVAPAIIPPAPPVAPAVVPESMPTPTQTPAVQAQKAPQVKQSVEPSRSFSDNTGTYDLDAARKYIAENKPEPVKLPPAYLKAYKDQMSVDREYAKGTDIFQPGIVILGKGQDGGTTFKLIDGWHRAENALAQGKDLYAYPVPVESVKIPERGMPKPERKKVIESTPKTLTVKKGTEKPIEKKGRVLSIKPEPVKRTEKVPGKPELGTEKEVTVEIKGEKKYKPMQLVSKTDLKNIIKSSGKNGIDFEVIKKDDKLFMKYEVVDKNGVKTSSTMIRPTALGLVEDGLKVGDTIRVNLDMLKAEGTELRAVGGGGEFVASSGAGKIDDFESRIGEKGKPTDKELKLYKKVEELVRKYAKRVGEGYLPRGAAGVFYHNTENIRLKGMNDLSVAAHEITHRLDFIHNISEGLMKITGFSKTGNPLYDPKTAPLRKELTQLYVAQYPTASPDHPLKKRMVEGYATLLQKYVEAPKTTAQNYPNIVREFLRPGGTYYKPVIGEILSDLEAIVEEYQSLSPLDKVGARVTSDHNATGKESFLTGDELIRTEIADEIYPIEKLAKQAGLEMTKDDPSLWMRQYNNISSVFANNTLGKRGYWTYENGEFVKKHDYNWQNLLKNLEQKQQFDMFNNYLVARDQHFNYLELDKLEANYNRLKDQVEEVGVAEAQTTVNDLGQTLWDEYIQAKKDYTELNQILHANGMEKNVVRDAYLENRSRFKEEEEMYDALVREDLKLLNEKDVGIVSDEEFAKLTDKQGYASLKRQFYDEIVGDEQGAKKGVAGTRPGSLKGRTGSSRAIIAPVYSGIKNHAEVLRKALKQVVYNKVVNVALQGKHPALFQRQQIQAMKDPNTGRMIFPQERDPNVVMGRINGKRVAFLTDAYIRKTMDEILDYQNVSLFEKLLQASSRFFTKGTTGLFPGFTVTNYTIDQITALAQTQHNYIPIYSPMKELSKVLQNKQSLEAKLFEEYMVAGGERQTFVGWQDLSPKELAAKVAKERTGLLKVADMLNQGADILAIPQKYSEIATRAVEYIKSRKTGDATVVALEKAGRVTAPFHHIGRLGGGRVGKSIIKSIPFFNPLLQVFEQTYRAGFKSGPRAQQRMLWVLLALTAANVAAFNLVNSMGTKQQKDLYKDLEPSELSANIWLPSNDGKTLIKLRMPNQLNQFGTLINMAIADQVMGTKYKAGDYVTAGTAFLPNQFNITRPAEMLFSWIPQLIKPAIMTAANVRDFPTIRPLESQSQQRKEPGQRSTPSTPVLTKKLGEALNISPIKLDFLITGYFGRATGFLTGKPGILNPFSTLVREQYFESGRRVQEYYDLKTKNDQEYTTVKNAPQTLTGAEKGEILKQRSKLNEIDALLDEYRDTPEAQEEKLGNLRDNILRKIDAL